MLVGRSTDDSDDDWPEYKPPRVVTCPCGRGSYNAVQFSSCYECFLDRRADYMQCIWCGRWHSPSFSSCFQCRSQHPERDEAGQHLRRTVLARDMFECRYCGSDDALQVDHIMPCAEGGTADPWNLQTLCGLCNRAKGATWFDGSRHDRARQVSVEAYYTYLWQYLDPDQQERLRAEVVRWLSLDDLAKGDAR